MIFLLISSLPCREKAFLSSDDNFPRLLTMMLIDFEKSCALFSPIKLSRSLYRPLFFIRPKADVPYCSLLLSRSFQNFLYSSSHFHAFFSSLSSFLAVVLRVLGVILFGLTVSGSTLSFFKPLCESIMSLTQPRSCFVII